MALPQLPQDKANHFVYGAAIYVASALICALLVLQHWLPLALVAAAGIGKEISDWVTNIRAGTKVHSVEALDAIATFAGGFVCFLSTYI